MAKRAQQKGRRRKRKSGLIVALILGGLVVIMVALSMFGDKEPEGLKVETQQAERRTIIETVTASGEIEPETQVVISSEISGEIVFLGAEEGDVVKKGQVLVRINPEAIIAQKEQANAAVLSAKTRVSSAEASKLRAESELRRLKRLHEKQLITDQELESAESQVLITEAEYRAAQYQVQQSEANLRQVQESVNKTTIVSPISGVVTKLNAKVGEKVVGAIQMTGTEIMTVADLSVIEAVVQVVETDVVGVDVGDVAEIEMDAFRGTTFRGVVSRIANSATSTGMGTSDQMTSFEVRLRFIDPDPRFRPSMKGTAFITTEKKDNVVSVPIQAVTTRKETVERVTDEDVRDLRLEENDEERALKTIVFVVQGDSVVTQEVGTGIQDDDYIEITSGLDESTEIVSGSYKAISEDLEEGSKIRAKADKRSKE